ncbi:MAG: gluconate 2-dehydrogenase subunit 3 family protein [Acidobacteria bacterium]|nr:gluconate 2-dehydrogenase subunit 3 family protein [Acidobacteriota bacterium]
MSERRESLKIIGSIGATCAFPFAADELYAQQEHTHTEGVAAKLPEPKYFKKDDFEMIAALAEMIIPRTPGAPGAPGALDAGVPAYIDFVVSRSKPQQKLFSDGVAWLRKNKFAKAPAEARLALIKPLCDAVDNGKVDTPSRKFFRAMKSLTSDGFWTSKAGMADTLGYRGASILGEYPECREH